MHLPHPHGARQWLLSALLVLVPLAAIAFGLAYFLGVGGSSPPPLTLSRTSGASPAGTPAPPARLAGAWTIASGSIAGYRVREQLATLPAPSDAVGRTSSITGQVTVVASGETVTVSAASFTVDVSSLSSDREMRDRRIHSIGLESDRFPQATFQLTEPIMVPAAAASGGPVGLRATGRLTIHGVTRDETIPIKVQPAGAGMEAVGSITFPFADFGMEAPTIGGFVSVQDHATMEFDLRLARGSQPSP
ncbi:MAG: YceI family protein [Candidatus Dormibacteria bacterium]